ncbi:hypothetical protein VTK73DRAFT_1009 [Phialemonium thermophilum]|uniref:Brl1/Brr6 domain-containing protein n=1 Tax=Phialemonium thermophilum TaxID=223376 RepID=A0ABR3XCR5_9PEZI
MPPFDSPSKYPTQTPNPFAAASSTSSPSKPQPQPPHTSVFNPQIQNKFSAPPFRNPAFTTPQKRVDELVSEYSGAESSPAMTDTSEIPPDTPDADRRDELARMTITPATVNRTLFSGKSPARSYVPGRGEVPRGRSDALLRDKVRKRRRQPGDRDVGSVRHRLPHGSDDSDSDWEEGGNGGPRNASARSDKDRKSGGPGWFSSFLTAINNHPSAPAILSRWVQLAVNIFLVGGFLWFIYGAIAMMRSDLANATEKARSLVLAEMQACTHEYTKNRCAPKAERLPALNAVCDEWEVCMNQDPTSVMKVQVSARNVAEIINEFVGVMSLKAWVSRSFLP